MQVKLLRFLDPVFAKELCPPLTPKGDIRLVASTSRDMRLETQAGRFRADLWYRISMVQIQLPSLRERTEDVLLLAHSFVAQFNARCGKAIRQISRDAEASLLAYSWPGNVTELKDIIDRSCAVARGETLDRGDLPQEFMQPGNADDALSRGGPGQGIDTKSNRSSS
jgi:DNA-binding NtrC family response regulator